MGTSRASHCFSTLIQIASSSWESQMLDHKCSRLKMTVLWLLIKTFNLLNPREWCQKWRRALQLMSSRTCSTPLTSKKTKNKVRSSWITLRSQRYSILQRGQIRAWDSNLQTLRGSLMLKSKIRTWILRQANCIRGISLTRWWSWGRETGRRIWMVTSGTSQDLQLKDLLMVWGTRIRVLSLPTRHSRRKWSSQREMANPTISRKVLNNCFHTKRRTWRPFSLLKPSRVPQFSSHKPQVIHSIIQTRNSIVRWMSLRPRRSTRRFKRS